MKLEEIRGEKAFDAISGMETAGCFAQDVRA